MNCHSAPSLSPSAPRIGITGASGFLGSALQRFMEARGCVVLPIARPNAVAAPQGRACVAWDPVQGLINRAPLEGLVAVVHLAGESIAARRWSARQKQRIRESRVQGTRFLCETLAGLERKPRVLLSASAIGYYGNRGDEILSEDSSPGTGFLPEVCRDWEAAVEPARQAGIRVVNLRIGIVLSMQGGALPRMVLPFRWGLGGKTGNGAQYMSWILLDDFVNAVKQLIEDDSVEGPVNMVSPEPIRNAQFAQLLGQALHRIAFLGLPAFAVRLALGEMGQALLLDSARVKPAKLLSMGFAFECTSLASALDRLIPSGPSM